MSNRKQLLSSSLAILITQLTQSVTTFILTACIARFLGAQALGQYLLAVSYYFIFVSIASQGLKTLLTRDLARQQSAIPRYLVNSTLLQFLFGLAAYFALLIVIFLLPYKPDTSLACYVMGLAIVPFALSNITEAIFQAQERMHLITISTVPIYILRLLVILGAMQLHYGVITIVAILVVSELIIFILEWYLLTRTIQPQWQIQWDLIRNLAKSSTTFMAIEGLAVINYRMQILMLSLLGSELLVGLFGGITQLTQPFYIVAQSLTMAVFPQMSKAADFSAHQQKKIAGNIIEILLAVALPCLVGSLFLGRDILILIYRDPHFADIDSYIALNLRVLALVLTAFSRPLTYILVANGLERINLREVFVTSILSGILGIVLISKYQLVGAGVTVVLMNIISLMQYAFAIFRRLFYVNFWQPMVRPLMLSTLMVPIFLGLQHFHIPGLGSLAIATLAYCGFVLIIGTHALGGPQVLWSRLSK